MFGSIHKTLNHILWGDKSWMSRFTDLPRPDGRHSGLGVDLFPDWDGPEIRTRGFDQKIIDWADGVDDAWLAADQTYYSGATQREWTRPRWVLVTHMFNHQTHHRGQVHSHADAGRRPAERYRSAVHAGLRPKDTTAMTDTAQLEQQILADIAAASDEAGARSRARRGAGQERLDHGAAQNARHAAAGGAQDPGAADQRPQGSRQRCAGRAPRYVQERRA